MSGRRLWLAIGDEAPRGPLEEQALRESWIAGVLPENARVGEREYALAPIAEVLGPRAPAGMTEPRRAGAWKPVVAAVAGLVAVLGLAAGGYTWWANRAPPLCKATPNILLGLKDQITIRYYVTRRIKKLDATVPMMERLLRAMKAESSGKLQYEILDVADDDVDHQAKEAGLLPNLYEDPAGARSGYAGVVLTYRGEKDSIKVLGPEVDQQAAEFWIVNKVREIAARADGVKKRIGVLVGHHEIALGDANLVVNAGMKPSMRGIVGQYFPFYSLVDVDLTHGEQPIDAELDGLIVTQPLDDLTESELHRIDDFVMRGKALAIAAGAAAPRSGDASMQVKLTAHGVDKLVAGYGLELGTDLVFDPKSSYKATVATTSGSGALEYGFIPIARETDGLDARSSIFFRIPELAFPFASSITVHKEKQPGAVFRVLAHSSAEALRDRRVDIRLGGEKPVSGTGDTGTWTYAATVEGKLKSAFGAVTSARPARVLLVSSSAFFANPFARAAGSDSPLPNSESNVALLAGPYAQMVITSGILALKNTLDWLTFDDDLGGCLPIPATKTKK